MKSNITSEPAVVLPTDLAAECADLRRLLAGLVGASEQILETGFGRERLRIATQRARLAIGRIHGLSPEPAAASDTSSDGSLPGD